jgi:hypothetical protein
MLEELAQRGAVPSVETVDQVVSLVDSILDLMLVRLRHVSTVDRQRHQLCGFTPR